jgi:hypothetical protein
MKRAKVTVRVDPRLLEKYRRVYNKPFNEFVNGLLKVVLDDADQKEERHGRD